MGRRHCCKEGDEKACCYRLYSNRESLYERPALYTFKWDKSVEITDSVLETFFKDYDIQGEVYDMDSFEAMDFAEYEQFLIRLQTASSRTPSLVLPYRDALLLDWDFISEKIDFSDILDDDYRQTWQNPLSYLDNEWSSGHIFGGPPPLKGNVPGRVDTDALNALPDCAFWHRADCGSCQQCFQIKTDRIGFKRCAASGRGTEVYNKEETIGQSTGSSPFGDGVDLGVKTWDKVGLNAPNGTMGIDTLKWETVSGGSFTVYQHNTLGYPLYQISSIDNPADVTIGPTVISRTFQFKYRLFTAYNSKIGPDPVAVSAIPVQSYEQGPSVWGTTSVAGGGRSCQATGPYGAPPYVYGSVPTSCLSGQSYCYNLFGNTMFKRANSRNSPDELVNCIDLGAYPICAGGQIPYTSTTIKMQEEHSHQHLFEGRDKETLEAWHTGRLDRASLEILNRRVEAMASDEVQDRKGPYVEALAEDIGKLTRTANVRFVGFGLQSRQWMNVGDFFDSAHNSFGLQVTNPNSPLGAYPNGYPHCFEPLIDLQADEPKMMERDTYLAFSNAQAEFNQAGATIANQLGVDDLNVQKLFQGDSGSVTFPEVINASRFGDFINLQDGLNTEGHTLAARFWAGQPDAFQFFSSHLANGPINLNDPMLRGEGQYDGIPAVDGRAAYIADSGPLEGRLVEEGRNFNGFAGGFFQWHRRDVWRTRCSANPAFSQFFRSTLYGSRNCVRQNGMNTGMYYDVVEVDQAIQETRNILFQKYIQTGQRRVGQAGGPTPYQSVPRIDDISKKCLGDVSARISVRPYQLGNEAFSATITPQAKDPFIPFSIMPKFGSSHNAIIDAEEFKADGDISESLPPATGNWVPDPEINDDPRYQSKNPNKYELTRYRSANGVKAYKTVNGSYTLTPDTHLTCAPAPAAEVIDNVEMEVDFKDAKFTRKEYLGTDPDPKLSVAGLGEERRYQVFINNNDDTPSTSDGTDFGTVSANEDGITHYFRVHNGYGGQGSGPLKITNISVPDGFDFFLTMPFSNSTEKIQCQRFANLDIRLNNAANEDDAGKKSGKVIIENSDPNQNPFIFNITGEVEAPPEP